MSKKNKSFKGNIVYSTNPNYVQEQEDEEPKTLDPEEQRLKVSKDTKHRKGKVVTLVEGFVGSKSDLSDLGKALKTYCGTGGSTKDGTIIIQGDAREKVKSFLKKEHYKVK